MAASEKLDWVELDETSFSKAATAKYAKWQTANEAAREARKAFEAEITPAVSKHAPAGTEPRFGFRFNRVSVAFVEPKTTKASNGDNKLKL